MRRVLAFVPLGPPYAGPEVSNSILLSGSPYELLIINTSFQKSNSDKGKITPRALTSWTGNIAKLLISAIRFRPDVFYYNISATTLGALKDFVVISLIKPFVGIVVVHMRGGHFGRFYKGSNPILKVLIRWYLVKCDRVIVQSEGLKEQFKGLIPEKRLYVVPNPAKREFFEIKPNIGGRVILFVGHLSKAKGWTDLLRVLPEIFKEFPDARVIAVGSKIKDETNIKWVGGEDVDAIFDEFIVKNGFNERFEFYENITGREKFEVFKKASIFVLPSYSEGFPMAVLEAMASALPVISTNVGAIPEFLPSENFIIEPGDLKGLERALRELLGNEGLRKKLSEINRKRAWDFEEERVRKTFWEVVGNPEV
ncbi:MAG: glycosyltransferase family 4 protein [candidate division WOR-3 bacterium]